MKYFTIIICYCLSFSVFSAELEMSYARLLCKKSEPDNRYPYEYVASFLLKNISNKNIKVISDVKKSMFFKNRENENELHFSTPEGGEINGTPLIPSVVDLKLVDLRPGEGTYIETKFGSKRLLEEVNFIYNISDHFDGRFGYWIGYIALSNIKLTRPQYCKT